MGIVESCPFRFRSLKMWFYTFVSYNKRTVSQQTICKRKVTKRYRDGQVYWWKYHWGKKWNNSRKKYRLSGASLLKFYCWLLSILLTDSVVKLVIIYKIANRTAYLYRTFFICFADVHSYSWWMVFKTTILSAFIINERNSPFIFRVWK